LPKTNNVENQSTLPGVASQEAIGIELGALDNRGWVLVCELLANTIGSIEKANESIFGPKAPIGLELGFENERHPKESTFDWDFAPIEKGFGEACLASGGLLNMAMYENNDLLKETIGGVDVFLAISTRFSGSDDFKLPIPCRPEGV
jgi:hypothetical protein